MVRFSVFPLAALLVGLVAGPVLADAEGAIKYRKATMSAIGGHMGAMATILKGGVPHTGHLTLHAGALADLASIAGTLFPPGSGPNAGETAAKAEIWEQPDALKAATEALHDAAVKLAQVAETGDMEAFGRQLGEVGKACKGCHQRFREKRDR